MSSLDLPTVTTNTLYGKRVIFWAAMSREPTPHKRHWIETFSIVAVLSGLGVCLVVWGWG